MRSVTFAEKESVEPLFEGSIYRNRHLGWLNLWDLYAVDGSVWIDTFRHSNYLIALQPSAASVLWLHSFYADKIPGSYPLAHKIKELLPPGRYSVYTISSHSWFNKLLENNGFHKCDEIVELETNEIDIHIRNTPDVNYSVTDNLSNSVIESCEQIFPPLWRLNTAEADRANKTSSYKLAVMSNRQIIGCLLADFADGNCHIQRISVFPEYQNRGAASFMIRQMVTDAKQNGITSFSVNTNRNNTTALHFYEHLNFSIQGKRYPVYYRYI